MSIRQATNGRFCSVKATVTATCNNITTPSAADHNKNITPKQAKVETRMSRTTKTTRTANGVNIVEKALCLGQKGLKHAGLQSNDRGQNNPPHIKTAKEKKYGA